MVKIFPTKETQLNEIADEAYALSRSFSDSAFHYEDFAKSEENLELLDELIDLIKAEGYDGITYRNLVEKSDWEEGGSAFIVFDPTQVKSATGNQGTFDPTDPRFNYGVAGGAIGAKEIHDKMTPQEGE